MKKHKNKKKRITFKIHVELRKYRGIVNNMAAILGKSRHTVYWHLNGKHIPDYEKVQVPYSEVFNEITGKKFTPEELFSIESK